MKTVFAGALVFTLFTLGFLLHAVANDPKPPLTMKLSSHVAFAPCDLRIQLHLQPDPTDRELHVFADSGGFYRRSDWTIDGDKAPHLFVIEWRSLGAGEYDVIAQVGDTSGARATVQDRLEVISPGH